MKTNSLLVIALCAAVPALACAKKPKKVEPVAAPVEEQVVEEEEPEITAECLSNLSLFNQSVKNKQFEAAYEPWWEVYNSCPNANKAIYSQGSQILDWKYQNATSDAEKNEIRNLILQLHDKRIRFFGNDPKYPKAYILGQKAQDYLKYFPEDEVKDKPYLWLKQSVEGMGEASLNSVLQDFVEVSYSLYKAQPDKLGEQFIADYQMASGFLAQQAADPANKNAAIAAQRKDYVDNLFAVSGAADCSKLDEIYAQVVKDNEQNLDFLNKIAKLYYRVKCTESEVYFAACEASHKLQPTEESAAGCASMCRKKEDYKGAIEYYEQALTLAAAEGNSENNADYLYNIAMMNYQLKNYAQSRTYARRSLEAKSDQGRCYILIGLCYAASQPYSGSSMPAAKAAILNKTVFWVAVDKFNQARNADPTCAEDAAKLISSYSRYFPTNEEIFDLPELQAGASFTVGGWIGETTTCRAAR